MESWQIPSGAHICIVVEAARLRIIHKTSIAIAALRTLAMLACV